MPPDLHAGGDDTLQHTETLYNMLQHAATRCNTLQHTQACMQLAKLKLSRGPLFGASADSTLSGQSLLGRCVLQRVATCFFSMCCSVGGDTTLSGQSLWGRQVCCNLVQCATACCSMCVAVCCSSMLEPVGQACVLQCFVVCRSVSQYDVV